MRQCLSIFCCVFLSGCSAVIESLKAPPFPMAVLHHTRAVGIEATIPNQAGDSVLKLRLGFFSDAWHLIPCSTNQIYIPTMADSFKLGSEISFSPTTTIVEDLTTGWTGQVPAPRFQHMFSPNPPTLRTNLP